MYLLHNAGARLFKHPCSGKARMHSVCVCVCVCVVCVWRQSLLNPLREGHNCGYSQGDWGPVPWRPLDGHCALGYGIP